MSAIDTHRNIHSKRFYYGDYECDVDISLDVDWQNVPVYYMCVGKLHGYDNVRFVLNIVIDMEQNDSFLKCEWINGLVPFNSNEDVVEVCLDRLRQEIPRRVESHKARHAARHAAVDKKARLQQELIAKTGGV